MNRSVVFVIVLVAAAFLPRSVAMGVGGAPDGVRATPLDSARDELSVGRAWHAARILRGLGASTSSDPSLVLLLARAEAGWRNWGSVVTLLEGKPWLDQEDGGDGQQLLGRAQEQGERWPAAAEAYRAYLVNPGAPHARHPAVLARLARVSVRAGDMVGAADALDRIPSGAEPVRSWVALELTRAPGEVGDTAVVAALLAWVNDPDAVDAAWRAMPDARLAAGDSAGGQAGYLTVARASGGSHRAEAGVEAGRLALARGDSATAWPLLEHGLSAGPLTSRGSAAAALLSRQNTGLALTLTMADVLDRLGDGAQALRAYDRARRIAQAEGGQLSEPARLSRARLMGTVRDRQEEALQEFRALRAGTENARIGAGNLETWAGMRRRQGRTGDVTTLRTWLLDEYPGSPEAAEVLWARASAADTRGDVPSALRDYALLAENAPLHARAGQGLMRTGQIRLEQGRLDESARVFETYLADFPQGGRRGEAAFWAARTRLLLADTAATRVWVDQLRLEDALSYYAVMGADLVGVPYRIDLPPGLPPEEPDWLTAGLRSLDLLEEAGLVQGAQALESALVKRSRGTPAVMLRLAGALNDRGRTVAGINLGWEIRRDGAAWDRQLLRVVYPFPHRELVMREAREWGVDPILMAALIRQESAFKADIRSSAGAVGLMQVMPPTGRELARALGPDGFQEAHLEVAEVNLHLGMAFFVDMSRRYDGDLPIVLSAYNAGPTRATRWRKFPQASDPLRFTERIPFDETRGYVKNIRRNVALYGVLHGRD